MPGAALEIQGGDSVGGRGTEAHGAWQRTGGCDLTPCRIPHIMTEPP